MARCLRDHLDEPAHSDGFGVRCVPHLPQGLVALAESDQRPAEVLDVGHGVGKVGVAEDLSRLPCNRPSEDPVTDGRLTAMWAEVVGPSPDRRLDPT
jgi:hypothetical protein